MSAPIKVLHICSGNLYGGVESVVISLLSPRDSREDLTQSCAYCFLGRFQTRLMETGAETHDLSEVRLSRPLSLVRARRRLRSLIASQNPDFVICHSFWTLLIFGSVVRHSRPELIFWLHDVPAGDRWFRNLTGVIERAARFIRPSLVICNSQYTNCFAKKLYPAVPQEVIYCPVEMHVVDSDTRKRVRDSFKIPENTVVIVQVGRLEEWKGHMFHVQALASMSSLANWECWIVGGAQRPREVQYLARLQACAEAAGISNRVRFLGQRDDVPALLASADFLCQPNITPEAFGLVFVEALAAGLPVVTTKMGGPMEIVTDDCGLLVDAGDPAQLSDALTRLVTQETLRRQLGSRGPSRAAEISSPSRSLAHLRAALVTVSQRTARRSPMSPAKQ